MTHRSSKRQRGRNVAERRSPMLEELGLDVSWPVVGWTIFISVLGFSPLLIANVIEASGNTMRFLAALGPVLVCLVFAVLCWFYGMRHAPEFGWSPWRIWGFVALFIALAGIVGWALFVSV